MTSPMTTEAQMNEQFPAKDETKTNQEQWLYGKVIIRRADVSHEQIEKHYKCDYFVLDVTHDPYAFPALSAYSDACEKTHPNLASDLRKRYGLSAHKSATEKQSMKERNYLLRIQDLEADVQRLTSLHNKAVIATEQMNPLYNRIAELEKRLELTLSDGSKIDIGDCDGIACRDETIALLDAKVKRMKPLVEAAKAASWKFLYEYHQTENKVFKYLHENLEQAIQQFTGAKENG